MKYTNKKIIERLEAAEQLEFILFWGHQKSQSITKSCFSQWYDASFVVNGVKYKTAEHYMMAQKALLFNDVAVYQQIIESNCTKEAKALGRKVAGYDQKIWEENRFNIVVNGNFHKFNQNEDLLHFLQSTGNNILVEASPVDKIWGIGLAETAEYSDIPYFWDGLNLLGYALMEVRDILASFETSTVLENIMLPPWETHPEYERSDMYWRMGDGEGHFDTFCAYHSALTSNEKIVYAMTFAEPKNSEWVGFLN